MDGLTLKRKLKFKKGYFSFPYLAISLIFVILPLLILLVYAFTMKDGSFTFENFGYFFSASNMVTFGRSVLIAFLTTVFCFIIAFPVALILSNTKFNRSGVLIVLFVLPMLINSILRTYAISNIFHLIGITNSYVKVVIATVFDYLPFMLLPMYSAFSAIDSSLLEAANDLGGNTFITFIKVKLPLIMPGIISGIIMVFMPTISSFAIKDIVAYDDVNMTLIGDVIDNYFEKSLYNVGSAYAFVLLVIIAVVTFISNKITGGKADVSSPLGGAL